MLDYRYHTFSALANHLNYTKAANALSLSQPAVTKHIQYLEEHLGTKLFFYQDRNLVLTKKGKLLKDRLTVIDRDINDLLRTLSDTTEKPSYMIGVSRTIGEDYILSHTCLFCAEQKLELHLLVENTEQLLNFLHRQKIDFALISGPINDKMVDKVIFYEDEIILVCSPDHPLSNQTIDFDDLRHHHLLLREEGSGVSDTIDLFLSKSERSLSSLSNISRIGNIQLLKNYIKNKDGIGFLYHLSVEKELREETLATITIKDFNIIQPFYLAYLKQSKNSQEVTAVLNAFLPKDD